MRKYIDIISEAVANDGVYSKLSKAEFVSFAEKCDLRGVAYNNEVFIANAFDWEHIEIRYQNGIPSLFDEEIGDEPNGFDFYVSTKDRINSIDEDWQGGSPDIETGNLVIWTGDGGEHASENRAFMYLVR